ETTFQEGITALQSRQLAHACERFERCLALRPEYSVCAYNLACAHALAGENDAGFEWLSRAVEWGFGTRADRLRTVSNDADLAALRDDARWPPLQAELQDSERATRDFAARTTTFVPPSDASKPLSLLVLLHDAGSTPDQALDAAWRARAQRLGFAILAPSGSLATSAVPERGMHWLNDARDLARRPDLFEARVAAAVHAFSSVHAIDRSRVWIAGVGEGAMVAFDVATRTPGLFRGALVLDGPIHPDTPVERVRRAASMGLGVRVVLDDESDRYGRPRDVAPDEFERRLAAFFAQVGFGERASATFAHGDYAESVERALDELCR
ncbi:MAG: hypothetical protein K8S98_01685, partial [Planctomycetes bacterium]|nr:hypothetical protein [Planctomycetota bacterium]